MVPIPLDNDLEMTMNMRDVMTKAVVTVDAYDTVAHIRDIFENSAFHHLIVTERGRVKGVISDRDLLKNLSPFVGNAHMERQQDSNLLKRKAHQIMSRSPVVASIETHVDDAAERILRHSVSCLPVVTADQRVLGIVTWRDLLPHCFKCRIIDEEAA